MFHVEQTADQLREGALGLGIALSEAQIAALLRYVELLGKWNAKLNLVGPGEERLWIDRHVLDSLTPLPWLSGSATVVDIGSGAGLPGLPLAAVLEGIQFTLVEPRANRVAFLRNALGFMGLRNVRVVEGRSEVVAERFPVALGRAVAEPLAYAALAVGLLQAEGRFVLFHQTDPPEVLGAIAERVAKRDYQIGRGPTRAIGLYRAKVG
jgi:16S rRNA (guanine527-N7)-methyltransferase